MPQKQAKTPNQPADAILCEQCDGTGTNPDTHSECEVCEGNGQLDFTLVVRYRLRIDELGQQVERMRARQFKAGRRANLIPMPSAA